MDQTQRYFAQDFPAAAYVGANFREKGAAHARVIAVLEGVLVSGLCAPLARRLNVLGTQVALLHLGLPPNFHQY